MFNIIPIKTFRFFGGFLFGWLVGFVVLVELKTLILKFYGKSIKG